MQFIGGSSEPMLVAIPIANSGCVGHRIIDLAIVIAALVHALFSQIIGYLLWLLR
jgi:hypothetical protein